MKLNRRQIIIQVSLLLVAIATWGLLGFLEDKEVVDSLRSESGPQFFSRGFSRRVMDINGNLKEYLTATAVNQQNEDHTTHLISPVMTIYKENSKPWIIRSETGKVPEDSDEVFLGGKVFIERDRSENRRPVKIITHDLTINSAENFAETDAHVDIFSPPHKVSGTGLHTTLNEPVFLTLKSTVRGRYVP